MGSFTANMYSDITLQAEGTTIYLTVKESYICDNQNGNNKRKERKCSNARTTS